MAVADLPPQIAADRAVALSDLVYGRHIVRWTDPLPEGRVRAPMPCHEDQVVTVDPARGAAGAICRFCGRSYELYLSPDDDGGYFARFTVKEVPVLFSRKRPR